MDALWSPTDHGLVYGHEIKESSAFDAMWSLTITDWSTAVKSGAINFRCVVVPTDHGLVNGREIKEPSTSMHCGPRPITGRSPGKQ